MNRKLLGGNPLGYERKRVDRFTSMGFFSQDRTPLFKVFKKIFKIDDDDVLKFFT